MIKPYYQDETITIYNASSEDVLPQLSGIHSCVTDPPYGISFMGKKWDYAVPTVELWKGVLESLLPGAHLLSFAGTRTQHRMAVRIEDAGFEIRDMIAWVYGSGFPKSLNIGKQFDKGTSEWEGYGTALKPALEPITLARKPVEGTITDNVIKYGAGCINIDGCRVDNSDMKERSNTFRGKEKIQFAGGNNGIKQMEVYSPLGRFPANLIHDGSEDVTDCFPCVKTGAVKPYLSTHNPDETVASFMKGLKVGSLRTFSQDGSDGSASRFFYCAKASKLDRDEGLDGFCRKQTHNRKSNGKSVFEKSNKEARANFHPTVKPTNLMRYLCKLVTPKGGVILDPFMGSGSTGKAAVLEGFRFIGIEQNEEFCKISLDRILYAKNLKQNGQLELDF